MGGIRKLKDHINGGNLNQDPVSKLTDYLNQSPRQDMSLGDTNTMDYGRDITNSDFLDDGFSYMSPYDEDEIRANAQPWLSKAASGVGRIGAKVASEIAKMPGVAGGIIAGAGGQLQDLTSGEDNTDFMKTAFDNGWVRAINEGNEYINNEALPVYVKKSVEEGNLWDNITSMDFWATEGADGIGYIVSMLAPGAAINKLQLGKQLTGSGSALFRGAEKFTKAKGSVEKSAALLSKVGQSGLPTTAKNIDLWSATMANTLFEAGAEAQGAMDGYKKALDSKLENGDIGAEEYDTLLADKGKVGRDVFLSNAAILVGPNAIMSKMLWGKARNKAIKDIATDGKSLSKLEKPSILKRGKDIGGDLASATGREGFFEEGLQTTTEGYISDLYMNDKKSNINDFTEAYGDMLQTTDGQKAIFLGAALGGGMQGYTGANSRKQERDTTNKLIDAGNEVTSQMFQALNEDIYMRNEHGSIQYEDGKPIYNNAGLRDKLQGTEMLDFISAEYDIAIEGGDTKRVEEIRDAMTTNMVLPFVVNDGLGIETLKQHLEASADLAKVAEREGKRPDAFIQEIMAKAEVLKDAALTFDDFAPQVINLDHKDATDEDYTRFYSKLNRDYLVNKAKRFKADRLLTEDKKKLNKLLDEKNLTREEAEENSYDGIKNRDLRLKLALGNVTSNENTIKELDKEAEDIWDNKLSNKKFSKEVSKNRKLEKDLEEKAQEAEDAIDDIGEAKTTKEVDEIAKGKPKDEKKRKEEEAAVNTLIDKANANPSLKNLRSILSDLNNLQVSSYSIQDVLDHIEGRVKELVEKQAQMKDYLDGIFDEIASSINDTNRVITDLDETIKVQRRKRNKIARDLSKEDKNPKGRNAKLIRQLIEETEKEIRFIDRAIEQLEKEKDAQEKELNKLEDRLEYVSNRYDQVEISEFTDIDAIIDFLKDNSKKFGEHRFELERLMIHKHYTEQNIEGIETLIDQLSDYRDVLQETLLDRLKNSKNNEEDITFLKSELKHINGRLEGLNKKLKVASETLSRLNKAITDKHAIKAVTQELQFWEEIQKTRKKNQPSAAFRNPVVDKAAIDKKQRLEAEKKAKEQLKLEEAAKAKELAEVFDKLREDGIVSNETYYNYVEDHMNEGEQLPNPPEGFPIPANIKKQPVDVPYYLWKKEDDKLTFKRGESTFQVSRSAFGDTKKTSVTSETSPIYETEGGPETYIETAQNLPKDKEGNVIEENLQTIKNDARVITGTDGDVDLPYVPKSMVQFERRARNKATEEVGFEINTKYAGTNENQKKALAMLPTASPNDLGFLIDHLPINAVFAPGVYAPLETYNTNPNLSREARSKYDEIFNRTSKPLRSAIIKEIVLNKTDISDITTTISGQKSGSITVAPKVNNKVAENSILELADIAGNMSNIKAKNIYVVNDKGTLENVDGDIQDLGKDMSPGELYLMIKTANGSTFPLKLNVKKVNKPEAELLFEIYKHRFEKGTKNSTKAQPITETNEDIVKMVKDVFKEELSPEGLFAKNKKTIEDLTIADVINFLIWDGTKSMKSQVRFDSTGGLRVFDKTYRKEDFTNSKEEFIELLTSEEKGRGKRRNISFKRRADQDISSLNLQNRSYLAYLINNKILNTNAITGKDEDGNYIPTFQGDTTIYLNTNNVRVTSKGNKELSDHNEEKKVTYKNTLRGSESDLKQKEKGLYSDVLELVEEGKDSYYVQKKFKNNPQRYRWERVSKVTALKDVDLTAANMYNAAKRGDVVDELVRVFFSKGFSDVNEFIARGGVEVEKVNKKKDKYGDITMSDNSFKELWNIVREYEIEFNRRGYTIYANTNPLFGELVKDKKKVKVGGAMDLLAKDKLGAYHIIDIKTSTVDRYEDYTAERSYYREKDRRQQNAYAELFYQRTGKRVSSILIMPITVKSEKDEEVSANSIYRNIARSKAPSGFIEVDMSKDIYELMGEKKITSTDTRKHAGYKKKGKGQRNAGLLGAFTTEETDLATPESEAGIKVDSGIGGFMDEFSETFGDMDLDDFVSKSKEHKEGKKPAKAKATPKKPSSRSAQPVDLEDARYLLWNDGVVTTVENRDTPIKDKAIIDKVKATAGKKAAPGGKSEEEVRKSEEKAVSLQKAKETMGKVDTSKMTDEEAKAKILEVIRIRSLDKTVAKELRGMVKENISDQAKLQKMMDMLLDKAAANEDVKKICNIK